MEVGSGNFFWEFASISNEVEELSSSNIFQNDGKATIGGLIFLLVCSVFSHTDEFNQIFVVELFHDVELMLESLQGGRFLFVFFDGHKSSRLVLSEFDSE